MYVDNYEFKDWMQKLLDKLEEVGKDVKSLQTNPEVMPGDKLLDKSGFMPAIQSQYPNITETAKQKDAIIYDD